MYEASFVYCCCLYTFCVSLILVTLTNSSYINIFQMEHFPAVKFAMGYEKNMSFLVITKSPKLWKKLKNLNWVIGQVY